MTSRRALLVGAAGLLLPSDARADRADPRPQYGLASWYGGRQHHGKPMASGRRFDEWADNAAHRTLPLGTRCRVRHLGTGRTATVVILDRGPFVAPRILDVSHGTARALGGELQGVFPVELVPL